VPPTSAPLDPRLAALLGRVWPRLVAAAARAGTLGFVWASVSTPFVRWEGERAVGHVGVIELPLVVDGSVHRIGSIHAVCTDPERRRRGLGLALMEEALEACAARYDTLVLTTVIPEFYAKVGFRPVQEHAFARALPRPRHRPAAGPRPLTETADDGRLLRRLLDGRAPVSEQLGSLEGGTVFAVALLLTWGDLSRAHYLPGLDVIAAYEVVDRTLVLYDVVGATIPPLEVLAEAIGADTERIVTLFVPDRLGEGFEAQPWDAARAGAVGDTGFAGLMARGPLAVEGRPFMLPPLSRT
jgi:ribosomal protein S18 acetylase RimI-like enzyme